MTIIKHKFLEHKINSNTEILIIGTFNPSTDKKEYDFFYGRPHNFLWQLLPIAFGKESLKKKLLNEKLNFISENEIDFIDLIQEVNVEDEQKANYEDKYIDNKAKWRDVISEIQDLKNLKKICFTRETYSGIPQMKKRIEEVQKFCESKDIKFKRLKSPARFPSKYKQEEWTTFFKK